MTIDTETTAREIPFDEAMAIVFRKKYSTREARRALTTEQAFIAGARSGYRMSRRHGARQLMQMIWLPGAGVEDEGAYA